jgi:hypothetical protein
LLKSLASALGTMGAPCAAVTAPRIIVSGATTAITRRTTLRKAFLAPWHPLVPDVWLYALADAQRNTGVAVHHGICVVTHHHLNVTPASDNLPDFTERVHGDVSCALNTLLARERYDAPRELFDGRSTHQMRLLDAPAQASQLIYEHNNCVAAGLVNRPEHMPGFTFNFDLWRTGYLDVQRPPVYFGENRPECIRLFVTPPPLLFAEFGGDLDWLIYHLRRASEDAARTLRAARQREPLGARRVVRLHPWSEPRTLRETGGTRIPTFRIGARGIVGRQTAAAAALQVKEFRREHHEARVARREGDLQRRFPFGTYAMRVRHNAPIAAEPRPGALVTQPGPLLCDIQAELDQGLRLRARNDLHGGAVRLLDQVRTAITDEAHELCALAELDFEATAAPAIVDPRGTPADLPVIVRHRFAIPRDNAQAPARRLIILRDRRRGRPPRNSPRHGADPPS